MRFLYQPDRMKLSNIDRYSDWFKYQWLRLRGRLEVVVFKLSNVSGEPPVEIFRGRIVRFATHRFYPDFMEFISIGERTARVTKPRFQQFAVIQNQAGVTEEWSFANVIAFWCDEATTWQFDNAERKWVFLT